MLEHSPKEYAQTLHDQPLTGFRNLQARIADLEAQLAAALTREAAANRRVAELELQVAVNSTTNSETTNTRMGALLAIGAALLVTQEIEPVLDLVMRESTQLFPGIQGALLFLHDPDTENLMMRLCNRGQITDVTLPKHLELPSHAFLAPRAMLMVGSELERILAELQVETMAPEISKLLQPWPPTSVLMAPLRDENRRMGALVLYRSTPDMPYHGQDLPFVQALADLAAVAIAEIYQRARAVALQRALAQTQFLHKETKERLDTAQAQLLQSAKLAAVGELAASVAHEINNPLYAARNSLYLVEQDISRDAPGRQFLDIAQGELGRIARIITRMRDFYRPSRAELSLTNINSLLGDTIEFVQTYLRHSQIVVIAEFDPSLSQVMAQADQLRQVFLNLVINACDAMPNGGSLCITTHAMSATTDQHAAVVIRIADTGIGITPEHMPHLFEPFYTTKPQGTGLGLAITAHIVTQHGGQITVDSTVGIGTTFTITLPIRPKREA